MTEEEYKLLASVRAKAMVDPEFIGHIVNACTSGVMETEKLMRQQAADMETMAVAMLALLKENRALPSLRKQMSELALSKLQKYQGKTFMRWDDSIVIDVCISGNEKNNHETPHEE